MRQVQTVRKIYGAYQPIIWIDLNQPDTHCVQEPIIWRGLNQLGNPPEKLVPQWPQSRGIHITPPMSSYPAFILTCNRSYTVGTQCRATHPTTFRQVPLPCNHTDAKHTHRPTKFCLLTRLHTLATTVDPRRFLFRHTSPQLNSDPSTLYLRQQSNLYDLQNWWIQIVWFLKDLFWS